MIELIKFKEWYKEFSESGAMRRAKRDAFLRGTTPPLAPANVNSGNTGWPVEIENAKKVKTDTDVKAEKNVKKKKRAPRKKKEKKPE